ncbi:hypothetical protein BGX23_001655 [Mortierella sp. AD031]|nr:hypothetical protein BGX23_001655 [Mortierella sp. AD031]KAG0208201.1 hypothetical protein BGX33_006381 [Mortierella sp. NVP41]
MTTGDATTGVLEATAEVTPSRSPSDPPSVSVTGAATPSTAESPSSSESVLPTTSAGGDTSYVTITTSYIVGCRSSYNTTHNRAFCATDDNPFALSSKHDR